MIRDALCACIAVGSICGWTGGSTAEEARTGKTYYVAANGNDDNDGLSPSTPWQTVAKVNGTMFRAGDGIRFRGGDTFHGSIALVGANAGAARNVFSTAAAPVTLGGYGGTCNVLAGALAGCPTLSVSGSAPGGILINNSSGVIVRDWIVAGADPMQQSNGIYLRNNDAGTVHEKVTVTNVSVTGFRFGVLVQGTVAGAGWRDFTISNSRIFGSAGTEDNGIQLQGPQPGRPGTMTNFNCLIEGNLVEDIPGRPGAPHGTSGNGILIKETDGCISQFNVVRNGGRSTNTCGGPVGNWAYDATNIIFRFNETYGMAPAAWKVGCDWGGFHLDGYVTNSVIEYSYAHDNWGAGFEMYITPGATWHNNVIRYNIAENNATSSAASFFGGITVANNNTSMTGVAVYNNTVSSNGPANNAVAALQGDANVVFANNLLIATGNAILLVTGRFNPASATVAGNNYYKAGSTGPLIRWNGRGYDSLAAFQAGTGKETGTGLSAEPRLRERAGAACAGRSGPQPCPGGYRVQPNSPLIGTGLDLRTLYGIDVGMRDYYGAKIPHGVGTGFNIGADGSAR